MALLQRTRILPQQRLDLPDFRNIEDFVCADFKAISKNITTNNNLVYSGFESTGLGTNELSIALAGASLTVGEDDGTTYIGAPSLSPAVTDALTPAATNYVELSIELDTGGADSRAFWDPTANGGEGGEFSQIVDTFIFSKVQLNINTSNFTGAADMVPVCEVDVNGSGIITDIRDARNMMWRLGRRGQPTYSFPWVSRTEPPTSQFTGADKDIKREKDWKDAVMSRILELDGGNYWFENSGVSLVGGFRNTGLSMITAQSTDAKWAWDGTDLTLTDSNVTPADADNVAAIRLLDSVSNLMLTRQDGTGGSTAFTLADGDVLWVQLPDPLANVNYSAIGLTASNFRVSPRGSVPNNSNTFWLAHRDGLNVYLRFFGELQPGEEVEISDNVNENILAAIGIASETDMPNYTSNNYVVDGTSLVAAISALDAAAGLSSIGADQDRSLKLIEGGTWSVDYLGTTLSWSADAFIDVPEVTRVSNRILSGNINLPNANSVAYVQINRASGPATLTVLVADIDAIPADGDTVIIARRVSTGILVGRTSFLLKAGEYLELDGALAEINRKLGQLKLRPHETAANKARIDAGDITQLDDSVLSQIIGDFLLKFDGAVINFTTGVINEADDVTPLGINFTPFVVPVGEYFWYGVSLIPGNVLADNTQEAQVQIDLAASANASASTAPKPVISGDIKLGAIQVFNNAGSIEVFETRKLGVGSGSGSGSGDANAVDTALRDRFALNNFLFLTENVFRTDKATKVDLASTGEYSPAKKAFGFSAAAQTMVSTQHLDADFLNDGIDVSEVELYLFWLAGFVDTAATYEVSRDGGTNWQVADMERIGLSNAYRVHHLFTDEVTPQSLALIAPTGAGTALNATTAQQLSSELVISDTSVVTFLNLELNRAAAAVGNLFVQIVKDNAGVPSTDPSDIVAESDAISIAALGTGNLTEIVDMPDVVLTPATYHVVLRTDAAYKAGTMDLSWRSGAGTDGAAYDGSVWTGAASTKAFEAEGRELDLRVRVTSSAGDVYIEGYGIYYDSSVGIQPTSTRKIQKFVFSGDENRTDFECLFQLDPYIVTVHDPLRGQSYVPDSAADATLRVDGNTLKFAVDTFDFPGEEIVLIVRQLEGNGVDISNENAAKIFEIEQQLVDIGDELASISDSMVLPKIVAPFTTVQNRALIPDLSQDLLPRLGIERIQTQQVFELQNEVGPNGESIFGVVNDKFNQVRFVGHILNANSNNGTTVNLQGTSSYLEVTFYGTGLNLLTFLGFAYTAVASVDGGAEGANFYPASTSNVLIARNTNSNAVIPVVSGLPLGIHTVKIRVTGTDIHVHGFEFINESASGLIQLPPGAQLYKGKRRTHSILETTPYNSDFETGVLGTRGGRVLIYQKADGSVGKAVTPTDAVQLNLSAVNHANEEIARVYNFREFSAGRVDDFSVNGQGAIARVFTLDDGTTTLVLGGGTDTFVGALGGTAEAIGIRTSGSFFTFTFVGTGLDIVRNEATTSTGDTNLVHIDGVSTGLGISTSVLPRSRVEKIVSGLPYGTHTVRVECSGGGSAHMGIKEFKVYQPKTPIVPTGAVEVTSYNIMANYDGTSLGTNFFNVPKGTLFKSPTREHVYRGFGVWSVDTPAQTYSGPGGFSILNTFQNSVKEYTFFGTGITLLYSSNSSGNKSYTIQIDGVANASGVVTTGATNNGAGNYTINSGSSLARWISFQGLTLGTHKITITTSDATGFNVIYDGLFVTTPIHSPKNNGPFVLQNTLAIGSQGISDLRKFSKKDIDNENNTSQAIGVTANPVMSSSTPIPMPEMSVTHFSKTGKVRLNYSATMSGSVAEMQTRIYANGKQVSSLKQQRSTVGSPIFTNADGLVLKIPKGFNKIDVYWSSGGGAALTATDVLRNLTVEDVD